MGNERRIEEDSSLSWPIAMGTSGGGDGDAVHSGFALGGQAAHPLVPGLLLSGWHMARWASGSADERRMRMHA